MCLMRFSSPTMRRMTRRERRKATGNDFSMAFCVVEAKRWNRVLVARRREDAEDGVPSTQMLRYLRRVDDVTKGGLRWGILTNGRVWRLYWQGALSVAEDFLEIDLGKALDLSRCRLDILDKRPSRFADDTNGAHIRSNFSWLCLGARPSCRSKEARPFHDFARAKGKFWEAQVAKNLSDTVFDGSSPRCPTRSPRPIPRARTNSSAYLEEVRHGALILLYRLLFVLYAEDRNLLPDETGPYADYCLTQNAPRNRRPHGGGARVSGDFVTYWPKLASIFARSPMATMRWAYLPTMAVCSSAQRRRSSSARNFPDASSRTRFSD